MNPLKSLKEVAAKVKANLFESRPAALAGKIAPEHVHIPERLSGETQQEYRQRLKLSRQLVREMRGDIRQPPAVNAMDFQRFFLGQRITPQGQRRIQRRRLAYKFDQLSNQ